MSVVFTSSETVTCMNANIHTNQLFWSNDVLYTAVRYEIIAVIVWAVSVHGFQLGPFSMAGQAELRLVCVYAYFNNKVISRC